MAIQESHVTNYTYCGPCGHPRVSCMYLYLMRPMWPSKSTIYIYICIYIYISLMRPVWPPESLLYVYISNAAHVAIQESPVIFWTSCGPCGLLRASCIYLYLMRPMWPSKSLLYVSKSNAAHVAFQEHHVYNAAHVATQESHVCIYI